jgi:hypothetical protein
MADEMLPSSGYLFHYTTTDADFLGAVAAGSLPSPVPAAVPYPIPSDSADWTRIKCISRPSGIANAEVETTEHRCGDPEAAVVEDFATGFKRLNPVGLMTTYTDDGDKFDDLNAIKDNRTLLAFLFTFPLLGGQTRPARFVQRAYLTKCNLIFDDNGAPIMMELEFKPTLDVGKFAKAATS